MSVSLCRETTKEIAWLPYYDLVACIVPQKLILVMDHMDKQECVSAKKDIDSFQLLYQII